MANEKKLTTVGQMRRFAQQQDARDDAQDELLSNHTHGADSVFFTDGETFQAKYDSGALTGPKGEKGETGSTGSQGEKGDKGDTGAAGKTAYAYAQDGGYTGTEAAFAQKLAEENPIAITEAEIEEIFSS